MGLRGPHAAPKAMWRYLPKRLPKCRCPVCLCLFTAERSTATFCSDTCRQEWHRHKTEMDDRKTYVLILRPEKHVTDPMRMLRALLKIAGRQFGLKAVQIREQTMDDICGLNTIRTRNRCRYSG
jgi:hypothetical protein